MAKKSLSSASQALVSDGADVGFLRVGKWALLLILIALFAFVAMLYFWGQGTINDSEEYGGAHARSKSFDGYAKLTKILESQGFETRLSFTEDAFLSPEPLVITNDQIPIKYIEEISEIIAVRANIGPTIYIAPKWYSIKGGGFMATKKLPRPNWVWAGDMRVLQSMQYLLMEVNNDVKNHPIYAMPYFQNWPEQWYDDYLELNGQVVQNEYGEAIVLSTDIDHYRSDKDENHEYRATVYRGSAAKNSNQDNAEQAITRSQDNKIIVNYSVQNIMAGSGAKSLVYAKEDGVENPFYTIAASVNCPVFADEVLRNNFIHKTRTGEDNFITVDGDEDEELKPTDEHIGYDVFDEYYGGEDYYEIVPFSEIEKANSPQDIIPIKDEKCGKYPVIFISDADLMNNAGLNNVENARQSVAIFQMVSEAQKIIDAANGGKAKIPAHQKPVIVFDMTAHGYRHGDNLLFHAFTMPWLGATLTFIILLLALGWMGLVRFGRDREEGRVIAFGKTKMVSNIAEMTRYLGRGSILADQYARLMRKKAAKLFGVAMHLPDLEIDEKLDTLSGDEKWSPLITQLEQSKNMTEIIRHARAVYGWIRERK